MVQNVHKPECTVIVDMCGETVVTLHPQKQDQVSVKPSIEAVLEEEIK